jgi:hypothetical protein
LSGAIVEIFRRKAFRSRSYVNVALTPVVDGDETLDLLTKTSGAKAVIAHFKITHFKKVAALSH